MSLRTQPTSAPPRPPAPLRRARARARGLTLVSRLCCCESLPHPTPPFYLSSPPATLSRALFCQVQKRVGKLPWQEEGRKRHSGSCSAERGSVKAMESSAHGERRKNELYHPAYTILLRCPLWAE